MKELYDEVLTLTELEKTFDLANQLGMNYIGVMIQMQGFETEVIINPKENFESKLEYYKEAYNEDLTLKTFSGIKIIGCESGDSFQEIQDWLIR